MSTSVNIGKLIVSVLANTTGFSKGMDRAGQSAKKFGKDLSASQKMISSFKAGVAGLAAGVSVGALASQFKATASEIDKLAKTSDKIGITTEKLAAMQFAGEQTGVGVDTMNNALLKMRIRTAEAAQGAGEAAKVFGELGLNAADMLTMTPDQQFMALAAAMQKTENQADKVRIATKLFEEEGSALVNTLALGESGLEKLEEQARSLGITISREAAAEVEKFNDAFNEISKFFKAEAMKLVVDIAPAATSSIKALGELLDGVRVEMRNAKKAEEQGDLGFWGGAKHLAATAYGGYYDFMLEQNNQASVNRELKTGRRFQYIQRWQETDPRRTRSINAEIAAGSAKRIRDQLARVREYERSNVVVDGIRSGSRALEEFAKKRVPDAWKALGDAGDKAKAFAESTHKQFTLDKLTMSPEERRMKDFLRERKERQAAEGGEPEMAKALNAALVKGTLEAWQAARADSLPKMQLDETKKQTGILADIRDGVRRGGLVEVGIS